MEYVFHVELVKNVHEQGVVVLHVDEVVLELLPRISRSPDGLGDRELLGLDEALEHHADGDVDVLVPHDFPQMQPRVRLRHADDGLDVPHRDGQAPLNYS